MKFVSLKEFVLGLAGKIGPEPQYLEQLMPDMALICNKTIRYARFMDMRIETSMFVPASEDGVIIYHDNLPDRDSEWAGFTEIISAREIFTKAKSRVLFRDFKFYEQNGEACVKHVKTGLILGLNNINGRKIEFLLQFDELQLTETAIKQFT